MSPAAPPCILWLHARSGQCLGGPPEGATLVKAYILIQMVAGHSRDLVSSLERSEVVKVVERVTGPYDVIAVLEAADINQISDIVAEEIHSLQGVVRTTTCICIE